MRGGGVKMRAWPFPQQQQFDSILNTVVQLLFLTLFSCWNPISLTLIHCLPFDISSQVLSNELAVPEELLAILQLGRVQHFEKRYYWKGTTFSLCKCIKLIWQVVFQGIVSMQYTLSLHYLMQHKVIMEIWLWTANSKRNLLLLTGYGCAENNMHGIQLFAWYRTFVQQISVPCMN